MTRRVDGPAPGDCGGPCTMALMPGESCEECGAVCPDDLPEPEPEESPFFEDPNGTDAPAMSEQGSTPGPWVVNGCGVRTADDRYLICDSGDWGGFISEADLALIAAAPALRDALTAIARGLTNGQKERGETFQTIARAALAAAEGRGR